MRDVSLPALEGTNPLGFLAALGVLDALAVTTPAVTLRWTDELIPHAIIGGVGDLDWLLDVLNRDRERWGSNALLRFPEPSPLADAKPGKGQLRSWFEFVAAQSDETRSGSDHLCAVVAEGAFDNNQKAKPTHLHFTAGQQQFLNMVRDLAARVDRERLDEALCGPWRYDSGLPSLSWDSRGERMYAVRATNPSKDKRLGVPGADWLAFRGLVFYPVTRTTSGALRTTACNASWKSSAFRWPLWSVPITKSVARSLLADETLVSERRRKRVRAEDLEARGIFSLQESSIRRSDQGGYGSFGAPETLVSS